MEHYRTEAARTPWDWDAGVNATNVFDTHEWWMPRAWLRHQDPFQQQVHGRVCVNGGRA